MPSKVELGTIHAVTDDDTGMYRIGEIDGGWNGEIKHQIQQYGVEPILIHLAYMATRAIEISRESNNVHADETAKVAGNYDPIDVGCVDT